MRLADEQDMIQAFPAHAAQQPLADGVRARRLDRRAQHLDAGSSRNGREVRTIFRIIVANEVRRRCAEGRRFAQLLGDPGVGG